MIANIDQRPTYETLFPVQTTRTTSQLKSGMTEIKTLSPSVTAQSILSGQ
jgi:hypothetical protein